MNRLHVFPTPDDCENNRMDRLVDEGYVLQFAVCEHLGGVVFYKTKKGLVRSALTSCVRVYPPKILPCYENLMNKNELNEFMSDLAHGAKISPVEELLPDDYLLEESVLIKFDSMPKSPSKKSHYFIHDR